MPNYLVLTPLRHDGFLSLPGSQVTLTAGQAAPLLKVAALEDIPLGKGDDESMVGGIAGAVIPELVTAIPLLDVADSRQWTRDGRPRTELLAAIIGRRVSATERDTVWQQWIEERDK